VPSEELEGVLPSNEGQQSPAAADNSQMWAFRRRRRRRKCCVLFVFLMMFVVMIVQHTRMHDQLNRLNDNVNQLSSQLPISNNGYPYPGYPGDDSGGDYPHPPTHRQQPDQDRLDKLQHDLDELTFTTNAVLTELRQMRQERKEHWGRHNHDHRHHGDDEQSTGANVVAPIKPQEFFVISQYAVSVSQASESSLVNAEYHTSNRSDLIGSTADFTEHTIQAVLLQAVDSQGNTNDKLQLNYRGHAAYKGETANVTQGGWVGIDSQPHAAPNALQGLAVTLSGDWASLYDVRYMCWMRASYMPSAAVASDVMSNGDFCGTRGQSRSLVGIKVWVEAK